MIIMTSLHSSEMIPKFQTVLNHDRLQTGGPQLNQSLQLPFVDEWWGSMTSREKLIVGLILLLTSFHRTMIPTPWPRLEDVESWEWKKCFSSKFLYKPLIETPPKHVRSCWNLKLKWELHLVLAEHTALIRQQRVNGRGGKWEGQVLLVHLLPVCRENSPAITVWADVVEVLTGCWRVNHIKPQLLHDCQQRFSNQLTGGRKEH